MRYIRGCEPWSITDALKWRKQHEPSVTDQAALAELVAVCRGGRVTTRSQRRKPNPYWPEDRKAAVRMADRLERSEESSVPAAEFDDLYFEMNNNYRGGTLNWKSSRAIAWWPVEFASDELVIAWLEFINLSHVNSAAELQNTELLRGSAPTVESESSKQPELPTGEIGQTLVDFRSKTSNGGTTLSDLLRPYARLVDLLDWRLTFEPLVSHREAFNELQEIARADGIRAKGTRRVYPSAPLSFVPTWEDVWKPLDLGKFYAVLGKDGRATGEVYPVESGPALTVIIGNVLVDITNLAETWRTSSSRSTDAASPVGEQTMLTADCRKGRRQYYSELRKFIATKKPEYLVRLDDLAIEQDFRKMYEAGGGSLPAARYVVIQIEKIRADLTRSPASKERITTGNNR